MSVRKLRLIKSGRGPMGPERQSAREQLGTIIPFITPAEVAEMARFRALTMARAARQKRMRRIMVKVLEVDELPPVA